MAEPRDEQDARTPLDSIQDMVADGSKAIVEGVQSIQRLVLATGRGVEGQVSALIGSFESTLTPTLDAILTRFSSSLKDEVDRVTEHVEGLEARFGDLPSLEDGIHDMLEDLLDPIRTLATGADERAGASLHRATDVVDRMERLERRMSSLATASPPTSAIEQARREIDELRSRVDGVGTRMDEIGSDAEFGRDASVKVADRIERLEGRVSSLATAARQTPEIEQQMRREIDQLQTQIESSAARLDEVGRETEVGRDVAAKLAELSSVRERLTRVENRVLETSKEQIARAGESTGIRDRVARLEARLTDLSREQVARAVESAGLRERVFRLEQRAGALATKPPTPPLRHERHPED